MAARDVSVCLFGSKCVTRCVTEEKVWEACACSAPAAVPEEWSCCRSDLLMNFDTKCQGKEFCKPGSFAAWCLSGTAGWEMDSGSVFWGFFYCPDWCSVEINLVFLSFLFFPSTKSKKTFKLCFCALTRHVNGVTLTQMDGGDDFDSSCFVTLYV